MTQQSLWNPRAWEPLNPSLTSSESVRAAMDSKTRAANYVEIAQQFDVANNPRYVAGHNNDPRDGKETYCNIYLCDVMNAMTVILPHWQDPATGAPTPMGKGAETTANGVARWLAFHAFEYGWMECGELQARRRASQGYPTCVVWLNQAGIGHVAVVLPGMDITHTAQAGGVNYFDGNMRIGFGGLTALRFYSHD